jgi:hypothetical protein
VPDCFFFVAITHSLIHSLTHSLGRHQETTTDTSATVAAVRMGCCNSKTDEDGNKKHKAKFAAFKKELGQPLLLKHMDDLDEGE